MDLYACETRSIHMRLTASFSLLLLSVFVLWFSFLELFPSVLWRCWFGGRKGIRPVKNWVVGCWHGYLSWARYRLMAQLMPLPLTVSCFGKTQIGFTFLVLAHPGSPRKRAVKRVCVCVPRVTPLLDYFTRGNMLWCLEQGFVGSVPLLLPNQHCRSTELNSITPTRKYHPLTRDLSWSTN